MHETCMKKKRRIRYTQSCWNCSPRTHVCSLHCNLSEDCRTRNVDSTKDTAEQPKGSGLGGRSENRKSSIVKNMPPTLFTGEQFLVFGVLPEETVPGAG